LNIAVLNGSPKGHLSVTIQYIHFIQNKFPQHKLNIFNIAQKINLIEKNQNSFEQIINSVKTADGILWAFPLYSFLVHAHYKKFIELIFEKNARDAFYDKYTAALSTSIHFYDHTAHNYINAICDDLGMKYTGAFSADMYDLLEERERKKITLFAEHFFKSIENKSITSRNFRPVSTNSLNYVPGDVERKLEAGDKKVLILTDCEDGQTNLGRMIQRLSGSFTKKVEVINLHDVDIKGGCLGCIHCGYENKCVYEDKDAFADFYNTKLKAVDVIILAGTIKDRYLSSRWKLFFDRSFFNCHVPSFLGKQIGFIISGPLSQIPNLRQILEGWAEWQQANIVDFITDDYEDSHQIDALLQNFAMRLIRNAETNYIKPRTFLGVGGHKIFRDDVFGRLRFPFMADHKFYKQHGLYDFPQKDFKSRIKNAVMFLLAKIPPIRKEIYTKRIREELIKPLQKILEQDIYDKK
jgi:multimeric flavodoxin WrbA